MTEHTRCPRCGNENLALMRTLDLKYCVCGQWMSWKLKAGQKAVGYCVDPEFAERENSTNNLLESESGLTLYKETCTGDVRADVRADVRGEG
jgi:hypothetical protein